MEEKFIRSFRFKNLLMSLMSMLLALLTVGIFLLSIYGIDKALTPKQSVSVSSEEVYNSGALTNNHIYKIEPETQNANTIQPENSIATNKGYQITITVLGIFVGFFSFAVYFSIFTKKISYYLNEINSGIKELSTGNFNISIPLREDNEFTEIARNLNRMAKDIKSIMELERSTEYKKNELITNVAHDLRTPLTSIIGYLDIVSNHDLDKEERDRYIEIAYSKSKRLEKLIEDLFTYTKLEFGQVALHLSHVDMVKMMEQMLEEFYPSFCDNGLEYDFKSSQQQVFVEADGNLLARAFGNLIGNAIKYGKDGKNINIAIETEEMKVIISITNYGEIIPKKDIDKIFEKFYRVDSSRNEERGGTGLGLAIAKNIISMHNGQISVRSTLEGTVFEVILNQEEPNEITE